MAIVRMTREERRKYNNMSQEEKARFDEERRSKRRRASRQVSENELDLMPDRDDVLAEQEDPVLEGGTKRGYKKDTGVEKTQTEEETTEKEDTTSSRSDRKSKEAVKTEEKEETAAGNNEDLAVIERLRRREREKKEVFINFMLDGTLSFSKIFVPVYRFLEEQVKEIDNYSRHYKNNTVYYGLTVLHEQGEPVSFGDGYFTNDVHEFLKAVRNVEFYGGSEDGIEPVNDGIETALRVLANNTKEFSSRGLIFLSDSKPIGRANFTNLPDMKYNGLRFVAGYLYNPNYRGVFKLVDGDGNPPTDGRNTPAFMPISQLLEENDHEEIKRFASGLLREVSVMAN